MSIRLSGPPRGARGPTLDPAALRDRAQRVLRAVGQPRGELSIALVDDLAMQDLNRRYRGIDRPTDVLSFSLVEGPGAEHRGRLLGDVVIDVETAAGQARRRHRSLDDEIERLLVHGVLHLLGHDHEQPDEARAMRAEERRVRRALREAG